MQIVMSPAEITLFEAFLRESRRFLEFGAGGSTCLASQLASEKVISVDSSSDWLDRVKANAVQQRLHLHFVDLGPTGDWGRPIGEDHKDRWHLYSTTVWHDVADAVSSDLILIDGRFRVACFAETIARARPGAIILFHDFANRHDYHVVKALAPMIATIENLSAFVKDQRADVVRAISMAEDYRLVWL